VKATPESRVHAEKAILGVLRNFDAYLAEDAGAADAILEAAYESGCAIRISRTTAAHAMSYQITKRVGPAHGHACMLSLPCLVVYMMMRIEEGRYCPDLTPLARVMGLSDGWEIARVLLGMLAALDMLPDLQPDEALLDALTASVNTQRLGNHPEPLMPEELRAIYVQAFTPMSEAERARLTTLWRHYAG
jgi:alcohol dehydrogenase class IV